MDVVNDVVADTASRVIVDAAARVGNELMNRVTGAKRPRSQKGTSIEDDRRIVEQSKMVGEASSNKRLPPCVYRLHPAKYLVMDKMLKEMFFPLTTIKDSFSFRSSSGPIGLIGVLPGVDYTNTSIYQVRSLQSRYRGLALFKLRYTDNSTKRNTAYALSSQPQDQGYWAPAGGAGTAVKTVTRVIQNGPACDDTGNGAEVVQQNCQSLTNMPVQLASATPAQPGPSEMTQLKMGYNLAYIEQEAANAVSYVPHWNTQVGTTNNWIPDTNVLDSNGNYKNNLGNAVWRIADGSLVLDVTNSAETPCIMEVVIHSMKKTEAHNITGSQALYNAIYQGVEYYTHRYSATPDGAPVDDNERGGWQAFYDPKYPLLKVPSVSKKFVDPLANEVHRSTHCLEPGQSKLITIHLGSLYNTIWSKQENSFNANQSTANISPVEDNAGTLCVAIGHSGFDMIEQITTRQDGDVGAPVTSQVLGYNTGVFVGKSPSPSQIIVNGVYSEKFYPMGFSCKNRQFSGGGTIRPSIIDGTSIALPLSNRITDVVSTDSHNKVERLGGQLP